MALIPSLKASGLELSSSENETKARCKLSIIGNISLINSDAPILYASALSLSDRFLILSISAMDLSN